ncbi:LysR family transcriptional regulator [Methylocaldum marinum]|uniref:LysR family transcriptional regulator n=1 Tax=Methylocaldum marinum TaxID=1432792 RepID=A0A250KW04_9GAMM|nr:LysR family transcriptional regulator [Methylocaldum marinum]BBA35161.1 LysR family transcriptional regulator [Methylocaldum marinum]
MRLTLDALAVLDAIDRKGSFAGAAGQLHRVPSAITYTVQKLEQDLDVKLFDRSGSRATLTAAGRSLLEEGRHLLHAAEELEFLVKRVATGWETGLSIAVDGLIPFALIYPALEQFYKEVHGTQIRLLKEVYGGTWDALVSGRADLAVGAPGEGPPGGGYAAKMIGVVEFVFAVAPGHPLACLPEPLTEVDLLHHRAVSAADSSRTLPPRTMGLLRGQDVLTVPDLCTKLEAQRLGFGVGYLPKHLVQDDLAAGRLVAKAVAEPKPAVQLFLAWRTGHKGKALRWLVKRLQDAWVGSSTANEDG